jgi:O-antigen/teichoic acid export membrane protein
LLKCGAIDLDLEEILSWAAAAIFRNLETMFQALPLRFRAVLFDRFFKVGTLLFVATMISHVFNFLFQVTMGRMLTPADYGTMNALLSTFLIAAILFTTIAMVVTRQASTFKAHGQLENIRSLLHWTYKGLYGVGLPAVLIFSLLSPAVKQFLHMDSTLPIILLGVVIVLSASFPVNLAFLGGLQHFGALAVASGSLGPLRYLLCVLCVLLGLGISGVFIGHILCYLGLFLISYWPIRRALAHVSASSRTSHHLFSRAYPELLANLAFALMSQFDLVLVKHLFPPETVGTYAVAAILGRAVMYLPSGLVLALFPMVAENHVLNRNLTAILRKALVYTLLLCGCGTLVYWLFPDFILRVLFDGKYLEAAPLLAYYGIVMLPLALLMITMNFHIARGHNGVWVVIALGVTLEMISILLWHENLRQILGAVFAGGIVALLLSLWPVVRKRRP